MTHSPAADFEHRAELLDEWVATRRDIARLEAKATALLSARMRVFEQDEREYGRHRDTIYRSMVAEYAAAGRLAKGTIEFAFGDALVLGDRYPAVQVAFAEGAISAQHMREIVRAGQVVHEAVMNGGVPSETYTLYEAAVLVIAEQDTPARTRAHARQVAATLAEQTLRERHASAAEDRTVMLRPLEDGLALLSVILPEALGVAIYDRLTRMTTQVVRTRDDVLPSAAPEMSDAEKAGTAAVPRDVGPMPPATSAAVPAAAELCDMANRAWSDEDAARYDQDEAWCDEIWARGEELSGDLPEDLIGAIVPETIPDWVLVEVAAQRVGETALARDRRASEALAADLPADSVRTRDTRTFDQIRADLLVDLLLASDPSAVLGTGLDMIQAHIQVTVASTTLAGLDERLAELDGHGPIHPDIARDLAGRRGAWTRLFLDPGGMVVQTDTYSPTDGMKRFLRARDQHCRFPGCRVPAARCDIDHNHDDARGGATRTDNLSHFCRGHHALKHPELRDDDRWTAHIAPDGSVVWRSPLGRDYRDLPSRRVMFA